MFAVVETGGKQYRVESGDVVNVEKLEGEVGTEVQLKAVMVGEGANVTVGKEVEGKTVKAKIVAQGKAPKIVVYKYKAKKNERKKKGHRQYFTRLQIVSIA